MIEPIWVVRAGQSGISADIFINDSIVAIGWGKIGSLEKVNTREELSRLLAHAFPEYSKPQLAVNTGQLYRFRHELVPKQRVVTYLPLSRTYRLGEIVGDYKYNTALEEGLQHTREVQWNQSISRDSLTIDTRSSLGSIATIFRISPSATDEIFRDAKNSVSNQVAENLAETSTLQPAAEEQLRANIEQQALELLQDKLSSLPWDRMQDLVAGLLRAMGYKTRVSPPGADRGRDIVASPDGFGFQQPSIVVEVKHRKGAMGAPEIRSFIGGLRDGDRGLYVSTGGFTREAMYEANRARHHLALMDMDDLSRTVLEHYDQMDLSARTLLPLRKIYWPDFLS